MFNLWSKILIVHRFDIQYQSLKMFYLWSNKCNKKKILSEKFECYFETLKKIGKTESIV